MESKHNLFNTKWSAVLLDIIKIAIGSMLTLVTAYLVYNHQRSIDQKDPYREAVYHRKLIAYETFTKDYARLFTELYELEIVDAYFDIGDGRINDALSKEKFIRLGITKQKQNNIAWADWINDAAKKYQTWIKSHPTKKELKEFKRQYYLNPCSKPREITITH